MEQGGGIKELDQIVDGGTQEGIDGKLYINWGPKTKSITVDQCDPDRSYNTLTGNFHYELRELYT